VRIVHPRTGIAAEVDVDAPGRASSSALYSPLTASIVPALVDRAEKDDFRVSSRFARPNAGGT
jgi:hypothetical protein